MQEEKAKQSSPFLLFLPPQHRICLDFLITVIYEVHYKVQLYSLMSNTRNHNFPSTKSELQPSGCDSIL